MSSLLAEISKIPDAAKVFEDAGFKDDSEIKELCYETLKELFPGSGVKLLLQRSRIWKAIQQSLVDGMTCGGGALNTSMASSSAANESISSVNEEELHCTFDSEGASPIVTPSRKFVVNIKAPSYNIYTDKDLDLAGKAGSIPSELKHRLVRATISNMQAAAYTPPFKSLVLTYPCLVDPETGHGEMFKQLKKRLYNQKPTSEKRPKKKTDKKNETEKKKETGKNKESGTEVVGGKRNPEPDTDKIAKRCKHDVETGSCSSCQDEDVSEDNTSDTSETIIDSGIMERHYNALFKESKKTKPNPLVINQYLNKEFCSRREWLCTTSATNRCHELLDRYPCFKNHVEVIEEVRRCLGGSEKNPLAYTNSCVKNIQREIESIVCYGVYEKGTKPPRNPTNDAKIIYVLKNLQSIFPSKKQKATKKFVGIIDILEDHEDPEQWCIQSKIECPVLLLTTGEALLFVGRTLVSSVDRSNLEEAVLALIGLFYLLDVDYPPSHEIGLTMLHYLFFGDKSVPKELVKTFDATLADYVKYTSSDE